MLLCLSLPPGFCGHAQLSGSVLSFGVAAIVGSVLPAAQAAAIADYQRQQVESADEEFFWDCYDCYAAAEDTTATTGAVVQTVGGGANMATSTEAEQLKSVLSHHFPEVMKDFDQLSIKAHDEQLSADHKNDVVTNLAELQETATYLEHQDESVSTALKWLVDKCSSLMINALE